MYATERKQVIESLIAAEGRVSVVDLAQRFAVTTETVRRDLDQLENAGAVRRVHGGAVARARVSTAESSIAERALRGAEAKRAIAARAIDGLGASFTGSLYFDAGTTTGAVAQALVERAPVVPGIEVVTHSMTVAHVLAGAGNIGLTAIGGRVRGLTAAAVGSATVDAIARLRPDVAIIGTNGVSSQFGLSTPDPDEAAVKRAVIAAAARVIVVAEADKNEVELLVSFAHLADIDVLVTDARPGAALASALDEAGVEVWAT